MNENPKPHIDESATPFDNSAEMPAASETSLPIASDEEILAPVEGESKNQKRLPDVIKIAGGLLIGHGLCLALNGFLWGQAHNDNGYILRHLLWFGCTFVLCGALYERKAWAWWFVTLIGGGIGIRNVLSVAYSFLSQSMLREDNTIESLFIVPLIAIAGPLMLLCVALLLTPAAKAAFGTGKEKANGLF